MTPADPIIHETMVDGVETLWVDAPTPPAASIWFRVGAWDETVLTRGVTHLVEHLALYRLRKTEHPYNGSTGGTHMNAFASGSPEEIERFFRAFSESVRAVPTSRLDTEAGVLMAEGGSRGEHMSNRLLTEFFGTRGPGLSALEEYGLRCLSAEDVQAWADRHCVRGNALILATGEPPPTLGLDLAEGPYVPFVLPPEELGYRPSRLERLGTQTSGACLGALCDRSTEAVLGLEILKVRLMERLRHDLGLVYDVVTGYLPLDDAKAAAYVGTDARDGHVRQAGTEFTAIIRAMCDGDPTQEELDAVRRTLERQEPQDDLGRANFELARAGWWRLMRYTPITPAALRRERDEATVEGVGAALRAFLGRAAVVLPQGAGRDLPKRPLRDDPPVAGKRFRIRRPKPGSPDQLIVGEAGLSMCTDGRWITAEWQGIALAERPDGSAWVFMLRRNGGRLVVVPGTWRRHHKLAKLLEQHVPRDVRLPERAVRSLVPGPEDARNQRAADADVIVRELRAKGMTRDAIHDELCTRGYTYDEAWEAVER